MRGTIWVTDREPGVRLLFGDLLLGARLLDPEALRQRLEADERPDALVIDGTQLLELAPCVEDLEVAIEWLRGAAAELTVPELPGAGQASLMDRPAGLERIP